MIPHLCVEVLEAVGAHLVEGTSVHAVAPLRRAMWCISRPWRLRSSRAKASRRHIQRPRTASLRESRLGSPSAAGDRV
eukprot:3100215-Pyramimonas_sp.AAC.1